MSGRPRGVLTALIGAGLVAIAAMWWNAVQRTAPPTGLVVITLDTTRADRLSVYGFNDVSLPHLEQLARDGVVFAQATTVAPLTLPAHTSLFTGLLPPNHGVRDNADNALTDAQTTLAEVLRARGFRTGAFVSSIVLAPERGLQQGFDQYQGVRAVENSATEQETSQRRANQVMDDAIGWLDTVGDSPFFLWTHLYDAHRPYDPPEPYRSTYGHNLYVGEIAFVDSQIGRLLQALERRHLRDRTVVIVAGDHGESLGGHGERDHGIFVYEDVLRVPLIVRAPRLRPARIDEIVRLTDIMPTVLDMFDVPSSATDGVSLVDLMNGRRGDLDLEGYSESLYPQRFGWSPLRALRDGKFKLIDAPRPELYDVEDDPAEERNIYDGRRALAEKMTTRLAALAKGHSTSTLGSGVSRDVRAQLASLGYVGGTTRRESAGAGTLPDPKDCISSYARTPGSPVFNRTCGLWNPTDDGDIAPRP